MTQYIIVCLLVTKIGEVDIFPSDVLVVMETQ